MPSVAVAVKYLNGGAAIVHLVLGLNFKCVKEPHQQN